MRGVLLGLDYGRKRIGIAVSTPLGTVHPRPRIERRAVEADLAALGALAREAEAEGFVLGLPSHMDGSLSPMESEVRAFAASLAGATGLPVYGSDERLTSEAADSALGAQDLSRAARKGRRDSAAACIILADFLASAAPPERLA